MAVAVHMPRSTQHVWFSYLCLAQISYYAYCHWTLSGTPGVKEDKVALAERELNEATSGAERAKQVRSMKLIRVFLLFIPIFIMDNAHGFALLPDTLVLYAGIRGDCALYYCRARSVSD